MTDPCIPRDSADMSEASAAWDIVAVMATAVAVPEAARTFRDDVRAIGWTVGVGVGAGVLSGYLLVGPLARLLMLLLRVTSTDAVRGVTSDDGFTIGRFSVMDTLGLLFICATLGGVAGVVYVVARFTVRHRNRRLALWTILCAAFGGAVLVHDSGVDFVLLEPTWLAIGGFVALPAIGGLIIALVVDRLSSITAPGARMRLAIPATGLLAPPAAAVALVLGALMLALRSLRSGPTLIRYLRPTVVALAIIVTILGTVDLVRDISALTSA